MNMVSFLALIHVQHFEYTVPLLKVLTSCTIQQFCFLKKKKICKLLEVLFWKKKSHKKQEVFSLFMGWELQCQRRLIIHSDIKTSCLKKNWEWDNQLPTRVYKEQVLSKFLMGLFERFSKNKYQGHSGM